jgi:hypothetical protein
VRLEIAAGLAAAGTCGASGICGAGGIRGGERLIHNAANGSGASSALRATAQATVNLTGRARRHGIAGERPAHILVAQHITGTDNHRGPDKNSINCNYRYLSPAEVDFNQNRISLERF